jgi:hypothetical protein
MMMKLIKMALLSFAYLCLIATLPMVSHAKTNVYTLGTGDRMGSYFPTGAAIANIVKKTQGSDGFQLKVMETGGSVSNVNEMMKGDIDLSIMQADVQFQAVNGLADWKDAGPQNELRSIFGLYVESLTLVASEDSGIKTLNDLTGKRVDIKSADSGVRKNAIDALRIAGIDWEKDIIPFEGEPFDGPELLLDGKIDAFFYTVGHPSKAIKHATNNVKRVRIVPIVGVEKLLSEKPYYVKSIIPMKFYHGALNNEDVETIGVKAILTTTSTLPDDVAYAIAKAIYEDFISFRTYTEVLNMVTKESLLEGLIAPIHPGAARYYNEIGLQIPPSIK